MKTHVYAKFQDPMIICEEEYEMPILPAVKKANIETLIPWNPNTKDYNGTLHFWIDDYKFNAMVTSPKRYLPIVQRYHNVIQPDHSSYGDWNYNIQRHQQFLRQWVGALWARRGNVTVIPNIHLPLNDDSKWDFFWAGVPKRSIISVSGQQVSDYCKNQEEQDWFLHGFEKMVDILNPIRIIYYGGRIKKLEDTWNDKLIRFSRHSFVGQQTEHKKYTFNNEGIEQWDKNQQQPEENNEHMHTEEAKSMQHKQRISLTKQQELSNQRTKKLSQQWKPAMLRLHQYPKERLYKTGQASNLNTDLEFQVSKLPLQKKQQLE